MGTAGEMVVMAIGREEVVIVHVGWSGDDAVGHMVICLDH